MGYWLGKRNISLVTLLLTVRNENGEKLSIQSIQINEIKSYEILSADIIKNPKRDFIGSIEIEIFSATDLVFPYPAITFAIKGLHGLTFVHSCGRIYNDVDDLNDNNEQMVAETGFDLLNGKDYSSFFSFVNGPIEIKNSEITLEYITQNNDKLTRKVKLKNIKPYGLAWVNLNLYTHKQFRSHSNKMCVKIKHNLKGFFPRFIAGNVFRDFENISLTHSYFDTSSDKTKNAIWNNSSTDKFEDGILALPFDTHFSAIELAIYPNFARSTTSLNFELFSHEGNLVSQKAVKIKIGSISDKLTYINLLELFEDYQRSVSGGMVRLILNGKGSVPARMKFGLNFFNSKNQANLPSNICFNAIVPNQNMLEKPGTFRWCPILDPKAQKIFLHNTSFVKSGFKEAKIDIEVLNTKVKEKMIWSLTLPYNGTVEILKSRVNSIKDFLGDSIGWISFSCSSPFVNGFYITDFKKGVIGADHLF